ncbi:MAG: AAA family ATPase [Nitrosopumilaceae archaeon]
MSKPKNKLHIGHVTLKNFRAYSGEINFDLSLDNQKTITIIHGEMGRGKTTILDAIYWCLYGKERSKKGNMSTAEGIINTNILEHLKLNEKNETFVEIILHDEDGIRYQIKNSIQFSKVNDSTDRILQKSLGGTIPGGINFIESVELRYLPPRGIGSDWEIIDNPERVKAEIEKIFPEALSSYFLFDAELLNEFFYNEEDEHVRNGIEKISGLPILDDTKRHLKKTSDDIERHIANKDVKTKPLADEITSLEEGIQRFTEQHKKISTRIAEINQETKGLEDYMRQHDDQEIKSLQNQMDSLKETMLQIDTTLKTNEKEINNFLLDFCPRLLLRDSILSTEDKFKEWENQGKIPLAVSKIALENILSSNPPTCICGTVLKDGSEEKSKIDDLMMRVVDSSLIQHITVGRSILSNVVSFTEPEKLSTSFGTLRSDRGKFHKVYREKKEDYDTLQKKLISHDQVEVQTKSKQLHVLRQEEIHLYGEQKACTDKIDFGENDLKKKKRELDALTGKSQKFQSDKNKANLARVLSNILEQCRTDLVNNFRNIAADKTTKYFLKLVSKKEDFSRVDIKSNYQTVALDSTEKEKSLSAGQSCCLALSYIAAIREIANRDYFMMVDSPLHNISQEERVEIAENLPNFIPGTQITLLVQDQEYTGHAFKKITGEEIPSVRDTLMKNNSVWKEYLLETSKKADDPVSNTTIREIEGNKTK